VVGLRRSRLRSFFLSPTLEEQEIEDDGVGVVGGNIKDEDGALGGNMDIHHEEAQRDADEETLVGTSSVKQDSVYEYDGDSDSETGLQSGTPGHVSEGVERKETIRVVVIRSRAFL
jgi:hypothetical protein